MSESIDNWYYADKGKQTGPFSFDEVKSLVSDGKISQDTHVWFGEGSWRPALKTSLADLFISQVNTPPPLSSEQIDNKFVWLVAVVPIIGTLIELMVGRELVWLYIALNIALCILDERKLKSAGHTPPKTFWVFFVPIYLWKRSGLLKQKKYYFWAWIGAFILSIAIAVGTDENLIEESACPLVTDIIHNQFGGQATCKAVGIDEEVTDGFYRATATLDNGTDLLITIEEKGDDQIYVQIPYQ